MKSIHFKTQDSQGDQILCHSRFTANTKTTTDQARVTCGHCRKLLKQSEKYEVKPVRTQKSDLKMRIDSELKCRLGKAAESCNGTRTGLIELGLRRLFESEEYSGLFSDQPKEEDELNNTVEICVRTDRAVKTCLSVLAMRTHKTQSEVIEEALNQYIERSGLFSVSASK